jgi:hypothetical protein
MEVLTQAGSSVVAGADVAAGLSLTVGAAQPPAPASASDWCARAHTDSDAGGGGGAAPLPLLHPGLGLSLAAGGRQGGVAPPPAAASVVDDIVFLYRLVPGYCGPSYGIQCAKVAPLRCYACVIHTCVTAIVCGIPHQQLAGALLLAVLLASC